MKDYALEIANFENDPRFKDFLKKRKIILEGFRRLGWKLKKDKKIDVLEFAPILFIHFGCIVLELFGTESLNDGIKTIKKIVKEVKKQDAH